MKKLIVLVVVLTTIFGMNSCGKKAADDAAANDSTSVVQVRVQKAELRDVEQKADFTASVQPEAKNSIAPQTPTRIRKILVEVGDRVAKGQRLVQLDATQQTALQTQFDNLTASYNRLSELYAAGGVSKQDLDNVKTQLDVAQTQLNNAKENTFLLSPLTGVVTARNYDDGDLFNGAQPVLTVMQINPVKLTVNVSESYYTKVAKGMKFDVKFDVLGDETFEGKANLIYPTIDEVTRTFAVELTLPNNKQLIRPGMYGRVSINFGVAKNVVVSDKSVVKQQGTDNRYVYVVNADNTVGFKQVKLGQRLGNSYEILSGLNDGENVVTDGISRLVDGTKVTVIE
jgi:RND family efflux transporter MFP subunit